MKGIKTEHVSIQVSPDHLVHKVTREKFDTLFMAWYELTSRRLRRLGRLSVPCDCDNPGCLGWRMIATGSLLPEELTTLPELYQSEVRKLREEIASSKALRWKWFRFRKALRNLCCPRH